MFFNHKKAAWSDNVYTNLLSEMKILHQENASESKQCLIKYFRHSVNVQLLQNKAVWWWETSIAVISFGMVTRAVCCQEREKTHIAYMTSILDQPKHC